MEVGASAVVLEMPAEAGGFTITHQEPRGPGRSASVPQELLGVSPSTQEYGVGSK